MPVKIVFDLRAILPVIIMFIVTAVETVGDISGVMEGGMGREATDKELSGGIICDGLGSTVAACFGVLPNTSFSQNVGLVAMTKVVNRVALGVGYGMGANASILANTPQFVQLICGESGIVPAAFVAIILNCLLPREEK